MKQTVKRIIGPELSLIYSINKKKIKIQFNRTLRLLFNKNNLKKSLPDRVFQHPHNNVFFGYYDVTPFDIIDSRILAMQVPNKKKSSNMAVVGYYPLRSDRSDFIKIGETSTWCWQQGCRLQWFPGIDNHYVLYNDIVDGDYGCVVKNIDNGELLRKYKRPLYSVSSNGKWGLSLNFSRLQHLRPGYGYKSLNNKTVSEQMPKNDGIWRVDLNSGAEKLLFSIDDIASIKPADSMREGWHYFNHISFSPDGYRFMFFHIWNMAGGGRKIRMFTADCDGKNIRLINDSGHVSHYCWMSNDELLAYSTITGDGEAYYIYEDAVLGKVKRVGGGVLCEDGHPSLFSDKSNMITDTYPDKYGEQKLLLYNIDSDLLTEIDREYSPAEFNGEIRCDLHPRLSPSEKYICIDCLNDGRRIMKIFDVSQFLTD